MRAVNNQLDDLRREIDEIDTALHDLLMRRTALVGEIGAAKGDGAVYIRPAREAQVIRRLIERHRGVFPRPVLVRIWREIINVFAALQGPLAVAIYAPGGSYDLRLRARDHFGSLTPLTAYESATSVVRAVTEGRATLGVLPLPQSDDDEPWWPLLAGRGGVTPRVVARIPFVSMAPSLSDGVDALAVAVAPFEASGHDRSYLILETPDEVSRAALGQTFADVGVDVLDIIHVENQAPRFLHLIEAEGFVAEDDPRLDRLAGLESDGYRCQSIGGYPVPLGLLDPGEADD